jgi:hypothetical protein
MLKIALQDRSRHTQLADGKVEPTSLAFLHVCHYEGNHALCVESSTVPGSLLFPQRLAERRKSTDYSSLSHYPGSTRFKICREAESDVASMTILQITIRRCLTDSKTSLDDKVQSMKSTKAADSFLSFGLMKPATGESMSTFESQKPGAAAKNRSSS